MSEEAPIVEDVADAPADAAPPADLTELEQFATEQGWEPEGKKDAKTWLADGKKINKTLADSVHRLKDQVERMASSSSKQLERALREQAEMIQSRFDAAVESGDKAGAAKAVKDMRELEQTDAYPATGNPEADFARDNPWYGKNDEATAYAVAVSQRLAGQGKTHEEQLEAAATGVRKRFPELFDEPTPQKTATQLDAPRRAGGTLRAKTFSDMPPEAKAAAESMASQAKERFGKDPEVFKKQYAQDYFQNVA